MVLCSILFQSSTVSAFFPSPFLFLPFLALSALLLFSSLFRRGSSSFSFVGFLILLLVGLEYVGACVCSLMLLILPFSQLHAQAHRHTYQACSRCMCWLCENLVSCDECIHSLSLTVRSHISFSPFLGEERWSPTWMDLVCGFASVSF